VEIYSQTYSRWVEAEEKLSNTPMLLKMTQILSGDRPFIPVCAAQ
jgi:hypothetical protein